MSVLTTYYLEMVSLTQLSAKAPVEGLYVRRCEIKEYSFNRYLYGLVGQKWGWKDKLTWTDADWKFFVEDPALHTWVAYYHGIPAGYYELQQQKRGDVEIAYFGLNPRFIGRGFGGYLLTHAIRSAWAFAGTKRVWVHTCSKDHPSALANYQARGLKLYKQITTDDL